MEIFWSLFMWVFKNRFRRRGTYACVCVWWGELKILQLVAGRNTLKQASGVASQVSSYVHLYLLPRSAIPGHGQMHRAIRIRKRKILAPQNVAHAWIAMVVSNAQVPLSHTDGLRICLLIRPPGRFV